MVCSVACAGPASLISGDLERWSLTTLGICVLRDVCREAVILLVMVLTLFWVRVMEVAPLASSLLPPFCPAFFATVVFPLVPAAGDVAVVVANAACFPGCFFSTFDSSFFKEVDEVDNEAAEVAGGGRGAGGGCCCCCEFVLGDEQPVLDFLSMLAGDKSGDK